MKKNIQSLRFVALLALTALSCQVSTIQAQDSLYIYQGGSVVVKRAVLEIDSMSFTSPTPPALTVTDIDGNVYHTVTIGTQTWMVENLKTTKYRDGSAIANVTTNWSGLTTGAYCWYNNDVANKATYGALYSWYAVADERNIAPIGWHVPFDFEWTVLENYLIANGYNYDGSATENKIAKSLAATTLWNTSTTTGAVGNDLTLNNTSGFTAVPAGYRNVDGTFIDVGYYSDWWSSVDIYDVKSMVRYMGYTDGSLVRYYYTAKSSGFSVRCVRD